MTSQENGKSNQKTYSLTPDETQNLLGREKIHAYFNDLIQRDIAVYLTQVIYRRLDLAPDVKSEISQDRKTLIVDNEPKIIIP